jgi:hypothetical protein
MKRSDTVNRSGTVAEAHSHIISIILTESVYLQNMNKTSPSWTTGSFVPTAMSYKLSTNNQTFINRKEVYASHNSSTKTTNNKIRLTHQKLVHTFVDAVSERHMNKYVSLPP